MKTALIGLGMVAETHRRALVDADGIDLVAVAARRPESAAAFTKEHAVRAATIAEIAADPEIDFAILATPPDARKEAVEMLTQAKKPILMEKPIERDLEAALSIVKTCEDAEVPLGIVFQHRFRDVSEQITDMVQSNAFGQIAAVEISVPWWRDQDYYDAPGRGTYARDGGGVLISQAIHTIDLALSLMGDVARVQAMARTTQLHQMESEDFVTAGLEFANGAVGSLTASSASYPGGAESITLHGAKGSARVASGVLSVDWQSGERECFGAVAGTGGGADPMAFTHAWHQSVIEDFAQGLRDNRPPRITGREALKSHALITALSRSSAEGRIVEVLHV